MARGNKVQQMFKAKPASGSGGQRWVRVTCRPDGDGGPIPRLINVDAIDMILLEVGPTLYLRGGQSVQIVPQLSAEAALEVLGIKE